MDEAIGDLVLAPFRDIASQGNVALRNAEEGRNDGMIKAAQSLVKEGDRALKRIEPLCLKKYEEFGSAFVNALKDDEEISQFIEDLNNLLYDFEEYVEVDSFEAEKFAELQGLSRKAVPRIAHIITRMKLEQESTSSPAVAEPSIVIRQSSDNLVPQHGESLPYPADTEPEVKYAPMPYPTDLNQDFEYRPSNLPSVVQLPSVREEEPLPPPPPLLDPWSDGSHKYGEGLDQGREIVASPDSAIGSENNSDYYSSSPAMTGHSTFTQPPIPPRDPNRIITTATLGHSLEQTAGLARYRGRDSISPISPRMNPRDSVASSANTSIRSSVSSHRRDRDSYFEAVSPVSPAARAPTYLFDFQTQNQGHSPHVPPLFAPRSASTSMGPVGDGLEPVVLPMPSIPDGLMPVEEEEIEAPLSPLPDPESEFGGCAVKSNSSFHQFKGFCVGAVEAIQGGLGIKHIKKQGLATGQIEVAKCKACDFELEWKAVERDVNNEPTENFKSAGIDFRLRFLSKSHMYTKNVGEQVYGCLFCLQLRQTTHPNDATVFFSQRQLFAHLARHPHPLPHVPGLKVVQGVEEVPVEDANNYDLHFSRPPRQSHLATITRELLALPTATALQTCRPTPTSAVRRPPDGAEVVAFAAGARILGIEFPDKYQGEWCLGWADHECGLLPTEAIRLDPPRRNDVRSQGSSTMKAVARWKFSVKEAKDKGGGGGGGEWLSFSKGEVITNIGWSHQGHWCWWGTNSKGRSGMFPRSHIEPGTLMEAATKSDRASIASNERKTGLLSKLSIRHRSSGSGGGGNSSPRASIY